MSYFDFDFDLCCACSPRHPRQRKSFETTDSLSISRARDYDTTIEFYWTSMLAEPNSAVVHRVGERIIRARPWRSTRGPKLGKRVGHHGHKRLSLRSCAAAASIPRSSRRPSPARLCRRSRAPGAASVVAAAESNKQESTGEGSRHPRAASEFCSKRAEPASRREPRASHLRGAIGLLLDGGYA